MVLGQVPLFSPFFPIRFFKQKKRSVHLTNHHRNREAAATKKVIAIASPIKYLPCPLTGFLPPNGGGSHKPPCSPRQGWLYEKVPPIFPSSPTRPLGAVVVRTFLRCPLFLNLAHSFIGVNTPLFSLAPWTTGFNMPLAPPCLQ